jgi:hypothetical protein
MNILKGTRRLFHILRFLHTSLEVFRAKRVKREKRHKSEEEKFYVGSGQKNVFLKCYFKRTLMQKRKLLRVH